MSGLQELAAIIGTEFALRSISKLYAFVAELRIAPAEIERIQTETFILDQTLRYLSSLDRAHLELRELSQSTDLALAVNRCGSSCDRLLYDLYRWTTTTRNTSLLRLRFRLHRRAINKVLVEIGTAKQTTIPALGVAQISLQLGRPVTESKQILLAHKDRTDFKVKMPTDLATHSSEDRKLHVMPSTQPSVMEERNQGKTMVVYKSEEDKSAQQEELQELDHTTQGDAHPKEASGPHTPRLIVRLKRSSTEEGDNNFIGVDKDVIDKLALVEIENCHTKKGHSNFISIGKSRNLGSKAHKSWIDRKR